MAAIDFPSNPTLNQIYEADSGYKFQWDGTVWKNYYDPGAMGGVLRADIRDDLSPELGNHLDARNLNIDNVGIITASSFYGSGANLTNLPATGQTVNEVSSAGSPSNQQNGTTILSFLNTDFNVVPLGNGQVRIESSGGGFASIDGVSSSIYNSVEFDGAGVTITRNGDTLTFGATLAGLTDTQSIGSATDGQVLKYSSSLGKWIPGDDNIDAGGEVGPDDYVEAAGFAYSSGYWSPTTNGAVTNLTGTSQLSAWIDGLNDVLGKLVPPAPPTLNGYVAISTDTSTSIDGIFRLCSGALLDRPPGWPANAFSGGGRPVRVRFSNGTKKCILTKYDVASTDNALPHRTEKIGPGDSGVLAVYVADVDMSSSYTSWYHNDINNAASWVTFDATDNAGHYGVPTGATPTISANGATVTSDQAIISITNNNDAADYYNDATDPDRSINGRAITPDFYTTYDIQIQAALAAGKEQGNVGTPKAGFNVPLLVHWKDASNVNTTSSSAYHGKTAWMKGLSGLTDDYISDEHSDYANAWYENTWNLSAPSISFGTVNNPTGFTPVKSSGVDHLPASVAFSYTLNLTNLTGWIYNLSTPPVVVGSATICAGGDLSYSTVTGSSPPTAGIGTVTPHQYVYANQVHSNKFEIAGASDIIGTHTVTSPFGVATGTPAYSDQVLLFSGNETGKPNESSGTIEAAVGNTFQRCNAGSGADNPTMATTGSAWNPNSAVAAYEAKIIGGEMGHSILNYGTGFFPVSTANYSSHNATQYCQLEFIANGIQGFNLNIIGTYSGLWVAMPNNAGAGPGGWMSGTEPGWNGWADCFTPFSGGRPGEGTLGGSTTAAPATGASGTVGVNFGTSSTANSTGIQTVFIRFKFTSGQKITGLTIT
jgi:hypothetical protein